MVRLVMATAITLGSLAPASAQTLRDQYERCVSMAYLGLLVDGNAQSGRTAEQALSSCETEAQQLHSLLINTNMDPKLAFSVMANLRAGIKRRLLAH